MDALALLCNLHADGPATLQRLRRAGAESLFGVAALSPVELARALDGSLRTAQRFQLEARLLAERLEERPFAGEEEPDDGGEPDGDEAADEAVAEVLELEAPPEPRPAAVDRVLSAWKELDLVAPPSEPAEYVLPRPPGAGSDQPLAELGLPELGPRALAGLAANGITTWRAFVGAPPLALAQSSGLPFTRIRHLQFLARRAAEGGATPVSELPGRAAGDRLEASGPFAQDA